MNTNVYIMHKFRNDIEPCPVCGSRIVLYCNVLSISGANPTNRWYVKCSECHHEGKTKLFLKRAVKAWNNCCLQLK